MLKYLVESNYEVGVLAVGNVIFTTLSLAGQHSLNRARSQTACPVKAPYSQVSTRAPRHSQLQRRPAARWLIARLLLAEKEELGCRILSQ